MDGSGSVCHPERSRFSGGAKDLTSLNILLFEIPPPAGENAGVRDDKIRTREFKLEPQLLSHVIDKSKRAGVNLAYK